MTEYEVRVTRQALEQIKEIVHYISNDLMALDAADNLLDKMKAEITKLSSFPKKHALIDEEPWRAEGVRKIVVKNFLIYYWVDDENINAKNNKKNLHDCNEYMNNDELRNTLKLSQLFSFTHKQATTKLPRYTQSVAWQHSVYLLCTRQSVNGANRDHYTNK